MRRLCGLILGLILFVCASCGVTWAGDYRFPLGLASAGGYGEIVGLYEDNLEEEGYIVNTVEGPPVGISFQPYYEFDSGLGIGLGIGPVMVIDAGSAASFVNIPVNAGIRYLAFNKKKVSPYLRLGVSHNIASGEYVKSTSPGLFGGAGIEILRDKRVNIGFEISIDTSSIEFDDLPDNSTKDISPSGTAFGIYVIF